MRFCLDANVFIEARNGPYGLDICPSFWDFLDRQADAGVICSSHEVYEELLRGNDDLAAWTKARGGGPLFHEPDEATQAVYKQIADYVEGNYEALYSEKFLDGADPWVIAQAKTMEAAVVTREKEVGKESRKVKIPNICRVFGVEYVDTYEMLRKLEARF